MNMNKWMRFCAALVLTACGTQENPQVQESIESGTEQTGIIKGDSALARDLSFTTQLQTGDVVFVNCNSGLALPISLATHSEYTHCGMFYRKGDQVFVIEASDTSKLLPAAQFFENTSDQRVLALRLKTQKEGFTPAYTAKLEKTMGKWLGLPYDGGFMWDDENLYCSELVYKLYKSIGIQLCPLKKIKDFDFSSPEVKKEVESRFDGKIPYEEPVVAPVDLVHSKLMDTVYYSK